MDPCPMRSHKPPRSLVQHCEMYPSSMSRFLLHSDPKAAKRQNNTVTTKYWASTSPENY